MSATARDGRRAPARVAFIGLGNMGIPMALALRAAGFVPSCFDLSEAARERATAQGLVVGATLEEAAAGAPVGITMLPGSDAVGAVVHDGGLARLLAEGAVLIDMSSSEPLRTQALSEEIARDGRRMLDAPVSGGVRGAESAALTIMVGGDPSTLDTVRPILHTFGRVIHVGGIGAGHAIKALNNLLSAAHLWATSEAVVAARRFGIDAAIFLDVVNGSSGRSGSSEYKWPTFILPGTYASGFSLALMRKDLAIACRLAEARNAPLDLGAAVAALFEQAGRDLPDDADHTEIARWLVQQASSDTDQRALSTPDALGTGRPTRAEGSQGVTGS